MRRWAWPTMGSHASLAVAGDPGDRGDLAVRRAQRWFDSVEAALSPWRADSDLSRWRAGELDITEASPLLREVLVDVAELTRVTRGGFNPTDRLGRYDPTGYVKGWAIERAVEGLVDAGVADVCLGVGGDLQMVGRAEGGRPWRAAIVDPTSAGRVRAIVQQPDDGSPWAVATSGTFERGEHIWGALESRGTGQPALMASVTVVGPGLGQVDAFATAIWALAGDRPLAQAWNWLHDTGCAALAVAPDGAVQSTPGMAAHLVRPAA
jgi:thiamine biosynthesis lipoprotein